MNYLRQALLVWFLLQLLFGYFEYRYKPDIIYIVQRLFTQKYAVPSVIIPAAYVLLVLLLKYLFR